MPRTAPSVEQAECAKWREKGCQRRCHERHSSCELNLLAKPARVARLDVQRAQEEINRFKTRILQMTDVQSTLEERNNTHGHYPFVAQTIQDLKELARHAEDRAKAQNPDKITMDTAQREALEMILHKIGRILNGDPNTADHWHDISGYATLVSNLLTKGSHI